MKLSALKALVPGPVIEGQQAGWPWWTYTSMTAGLALLVLFAAWERRVQTKGGSARHCHVGECGRPGRIRGVTTATPSYKGHRYPVEIINHCVWLYFTVPAELP